MKVYLFIIGFALCLLGCQSADNQLTGSWDDEQGQILILEGSGEGQWIFYKNAPGDTFNIDYKVDRSKDPNHLDITLKQGAIGGETLYGVYKITEDGNMLFDADRQESARPEDFSSGQTKTYVRKE